MRNKFKFGLLHGVPAVILGTLTVASFQGFHSHLPSSHILIYSATSLLMFFALSDIIVNIKNTLLRSSVLWIFFTINVVLFAITTDYVRHHDWIRIPPISNSEYYFEEALNYTLICIVFLPVIYIAEFVGKRHKGKCSTIG